MKFAIPEISWHNRDPVLSVDFQPKCDENEPVRLATGGTDSHILIWYLTTTESGAVNLEVAADLTRHQKAVNVVRWSPNGQLLASGDDESIIFIWKQKLEKEPTSNIEQNEEQYKESWVVYKTLRGHMEDVLDLSWSADSLHIASGSVDNKLLVWDVTRGRYSCILSDHKGFVQGVCWDPKGQLIATASTDRTFRTFDVVSKKVTSRSSKAILPFPEGHSLHNVRARLYHDDTLQTFYRRLQFSPDGLLIAVPAGQIEPEQGKMEGKPLNAVYIYTRYCLKMPACILPCGDPALVTRWSPLEYSLREEGPAPAFPAARRMVLAVGTRRSVLVYDTQQKTPLALISNIHYTRLTDLTWSQDGLTLVASSTDGFCSLITFSPGELGQPVPIETVVQNDAPEPMEVQTEDQPVETPKENPPNTLLPKDKPTNVLTTNDKPTNVLTPKDKPTNVLTPKDKPTNVHTPKDKPTNVLTPKDKPTNVLTPKDKPTNVLTPKDKPTNVLTPKEKPTNVLIPKKKPTEHKTKDKQPESKSTTPKIDSFIKFKAPSKSKKTDPPKTPVKIDVMEESAMPSWSDNSNNEIIRPKENEQMDVDKPDIMIIEDSEDIKLVYEDTSEPKSTETSPQTESPTNTNSTQSSASENTFLKTAKVTDVKEAVPIKVVPSPKAPRRVNFVTLSSPKNKKKL